MQVKISSSSALFSSAKTAIALTVVLIGGSGHLVHAQRREPANRQVANTPEVREQVKKVIPAIGLIMVRGASKSEQNFRPRGSAVIVRKDGLLVTNFHVIALDRSTRLYDELFFSLPSDLSADAATATRRFRVKPVLINQDRDLALLQVLSDQPDAAPLVLPFVEIGDSRTMELLEDIFIIGFPEKGGTTVTVNLGIVEGKDTLDNWIKTDGRLLHGNSGGAAVNSAGKLIGISTKVEVDSDTEKIYGSVGYLRPSHLVATMISKHQETEVKAHQQDAPTIPIAPVLPSASEAKAQGLIAVRGVVKSTTGKPIAGARVGLLLVGKAVAESNLITWGGSNADGQFKLEKPVLPGRYTLRAREIGYEAFSLDLDISSANIPIVIALKPISKE